MEMTDGDFRTLLAQQRSEDFDWHAARTDPTLILPTRYKAASVDDFGSEIDTGKILADLRRGKGIVLYGPPGTGKTHLAAALIRKAYDDNWCSRPGWANTADLFDTMRRSFSDKDVKVPNFTTSDFMVFEDIGRERPSSFVLEQFYILVNKAYENLTPTIITTNLNPKDLGSFVGEQAFDRIQEMTPNLLNLNGPSRRGA